MRLDVIRKRPTPRTRRWKEPCICINNTDGREPHREKRDDSDGKDEEEDNVDEDDEENEEMEEDGFSGVLYKQALQKTNEPTATSINDWPNS